MPQLSVASALVSHKLWSGGLPAGQMPAPGHGALLGHQWEPWQLAEWNFAAGFEDAEVLAVSVMVELAESQGYDHAIHVNEDGSMDRGLWQLNTIHKWITDEIAYDPVKATAAAFKLYVAANSSFRDWAAYTTDVYLHDTYLGKAARGVGNFLARDFLAQPVKDWAGKPYEHRFKGSILNYEHRLAGCVHHVEVAKKDLGWQAATKTKVNTVQGDLSNAIVASKQLLPN